MAYSILHLRRETDAERTVVNVVAGSVLASGLFVIITSLINQLTTRLSVHNFSLNEQLSLIIGITLVYLSNLLWRRKQTAWIVTLGVYALYLLISFNEIGHLSAHHRVSTLFIIRNLLVPIIVVGGLTYSRRSYRVKSDIRSFGVSLRIIFIVLVVSFCYGVSGYVLMDKSDFGQEISIPTAIHLTVDQFGFTTNAMLVPHSKRARVFVDSLNLISTVSVAYALISLFQPLRARLGDQRNNREIANRLLASHHGTSEDFFKLWPHDKSYYFNQNMTAGVAYRVHRGIALVVGDPFGGVSELKNLLREFIEFCRINDWLPSFIHTEPHFNNLYKDLGFSVQKIGEEAILNNKHFVDNVSTNKYFRNINNKFKNQGYSFEKLTPPHDKAYITRFEEISNDWLSLPGRTERGLLMGYFSEEYMQQCTVYVIRDKAETIQAFLNQVPSFDRDEANYDLIRHSQKSLSNSVDFLLMNFVKSLHENSIKRLNLGLCPLVGLDKNDEDRSIVDSALQFVYSNGDRFYSFSGLHRFKAKYEPTWSDRYIAYKPGIRIFTRTANALNRAMKPHRF